MHLSRLAYLLVIIAIFLVLPSKAQRRESGYILKESYSIKGYLNPAADALVGRPISFSETLKSTVTIYNPEDIMEYGIDDGYVYLSKNIEGRQLFLRRLARGKLNLYSTKIDGKLNLYLEDDTLITLLEKDEFRDQIKTSMDNLSEAADLSKLVYYNQKSLPRLVKYYNASALSFFPYTRFGIIIGTSSRKLNLEYRGFEPSFRSNLGVTFGGFIDIPNGVYSKISTRIELIYKSHTYSLHEENSFIERDYAIELATINLPVLLRFRKYYSSMQPFFEFGFVFGYNVKNNIKLTESTFNNNGTTVTELDLDIIDTKEFGGALGLGFDYQLNYKRVLGIELRYHATFGIEGRIEHTIGDLQILASFSF